MALSTAGFQQFSALKDVVLAGADLGPGTLAEAGLSQVLGWGGLAVSLALGAWAMKGEALPLHVASGVVVAAALAGLLSTQAELEALEEKTVREAAAAPAPEPTGDDLPGQAAETPP